MSIPGVQAITMRAKRITCVEFNAFNNFGVCDQIINIFNRDRIVVVIVETKRFYFLKNMFFALLSDKEKFDSTNYKFQNLRDKYSIHRGILRLILSRLLDIKNADVNISASSYGKPFIDGSYNLRFNLSHSNNYALYAFALGSEVGIDVEENNNQININEIAPLVLSAGEQRDFSTLDSFEQRHNFFKLWTLKEALTKNYGLGMSMNFNKIHLGLNNYSFENLLLYDLSVANSYYAALALEANFFSFIKLK